MALKKKNKFKDFCDDWDDYMAQKKAKLEEQFQEAAKHEFSEPSHLFNGVSIFVNGYTNPTADELKRLMMAHGGIYHHYLRSQSTTHMIASNLPYSKIVAYRKAQRPLPLCKPEWITDSIKAGKLLDYKNYLLYSQCTETQPAIFSHFTKQTKSPQPVQSESSSTNTIAPSETITSKSEEGKSPSTSYPIVPGSTAANCTKNPEFLTEFYNNSRLHHISTMGAMFKDYINDLRDKHDGTFPGLEFLKTQSFDRYKAGSSTRHDDVDSDEELFDGKLYDDLPNEKTAPSTNKNLIIMHIDMDCFFVSVGLRKNPKLRGFPIAVAHAKGNKSSNNDEYGSMSEIASCSYEARKAGVKNGMLLGKALKLCPNLKVIRYDFEGYKEVSYTLYDTVASYTLDIEAVSCDEMYADCSKILQQSKLTALEFATILRSEIKRKTGCPVSTGFGHNKLQARLATKKAKPDGQYYLRGDAVVSFIRTLNVKDLPGVGWSTSHKLGEMNIQVCADLETKSLYELQKEFGKKNGQQLYDMCRGIDNTRLSLEHVRKSVSAEVNYGIRFENAAAAHEFLKKLSEEVSDRLKKISSKGKCMTLKVLFRAKDAPNEPKKFMGHGLCDAFNKSKNFVAPTDDPVTIAREVINLWNQFQQSPEDARGIGIQMTKLESTKSKASGSTIFKFIDNMKAAVPADNNNSHSTIPIAKKHQPTKGSLMNFFQPQSKSNLKLQDNNTATSSIGNRSKSNEMQLNDRVLDNLMNIDKHAEIAKHDNSKALANNDITLSIEKQFLEKEIYFEGVNKDDLDSEESEWRNSNNTDPNLDNQIESESEAIKFDDDELNEVLGNKKDEPILGNVDTHSSDRNIRILSNLDSDLDSDNSNHCQNARRAAELNSKNSSQFRQTKQSQFFKQIKPFSSTRAGKVKLPELQEIDMQVLIELPEDIRNEILNEYKEKKNEEENREDSKDFKTPEPPEPSTSNQANTSANEVDISFSQIDPEFLAALPNDMKNEVKHYCDPQRKAKKPQTEDKHANNGWDIFKNDEKQQKNVLKSKRGRPRLADRMVKSKEKKAVASTSNNRFVRDSESTANRGRVDVPEKNQKNRLNEETSAENKSFYFDNSNGDSEHNKMLSNLVSCLLELSISQVKLQIMQWISNSSEVNDVDFLSLTTYLGTLPKKRRLVDLHILMKCLHRCITATDSCVWHDTYKKMVSHVQVRMRQEYEYDLMIPSEVDCNRCHTSTL